jgi:putative phosphonate metabolism protein
VPRFAIYWAPALEDPLHAAGSAWLGRDAETGAALPQPDIPGIAELTADPRGYGLHATLKPPFKLRESYAALLDDLRAFASRTAPFDLPALAVADLKGFLALRETSPCPALHALADGAVAALDRHRAPPSDEELERRRRAGLTPRQEALLQLWGYPYVMEDWRFHVTLTRRLSPEEKARLRPAAEAHFAGIAELPRRVQSICLFSQAGPGAPFLQAERVALSG